MRNSLGFAKPSSETRVVVAMSGGVDSSVVAGLLAEEGYKVVGITLQLYDHGAVAKRAGSCCAGQDIADARRVAERLGIPYYVLDYERRFREAVIDPFAAAYAAGETPVPCVSCNQTVKFADLLEVARDLGADCLATGHYIRSVEGPEGRGRRLLRPADAERDQSWFLFATTPAQVEYLRFPLGDMSKDEVRGHASRLGLVTAAKPDSQDICFVPRGSYFEVIDTIAPRASRRGEIVHVDGRALGQHDGVTRFTIGQRKGLGIAAAEPLYVVHIDARRSRVVVGPREALLTRRLFLRDVNWLGDEPLSALAGAPRALSVKVRSTRPPVPATLAIEDGRAVVALAEGEEGVAPGQACVFYEDADDGTTRVLGGGFIDAAERAPDIERALARLAVSAERAAA